MDKLLKKILNKFKFLFDKHVPNYLLSNSTYVTKPRVGLSTEIVNCKLGRHNSIGRNSLLYGCEVGDFSYTAENCSFMNAEIGKFCSIGRNVGIGLGMHPSNTFVSTHPAFFSPHQQCGYSFAQQSYFQEMGKTKVGNDVWIGANAVIMDNVTIHDGAIIGAGAIVTKDIPPYAIAVGNPAKILRYRFTETEIENLLNQEWWNHDIAYLEKNFMLFHNIDNFKEPNT